LTARIEQVQEQYRCLLNILNTLIDWCLTPTLAVFQLLSYYKLFRLLLHFN
jgi:hypothetical protein